MVTYALTHGTSFAMGIGGGNVMVETLQPAATHGQSSKRIDGGGQIDEVASGSGHFSETGAAGGDSFVSDYK
jgi:hypothetical protein